MDSSALTDGSMVELVQQHIEHLKTLRQTNRVLYGHPSPLLWREVDVPVENILKQHSLPSAKTHKRLNVHVSTPFCLPTKPPRCGFCYLPCEALESSGQLDLYLEHLQQEGAKYRPFLEGAELISVYFGGGTANLYPAHQYRRLMDIAQSVLGTFDDSVQVTLEGVPQLYSETKLEAMKEAGINRISIGVQQLEPEMIGMSGRKQTKEQVFRTIESCHGLGLGCSVDLIYGWPLQTVDTMMADLEAITAAGVAHITHYELNVAGRTDFARNRAHQLPTTDENLELYRTARAFLENEGYIQITAHDWRKPRPDETGDHRFEESWHLPLSRRRDTLHSIDMWGWGYGGVSFFLGTPESPGWTFRNHTNVGTYQASVVQGRFPVERGFEFTPTDQRLNVLFQALQGFRVDRREYHSVFGIDVVEEHSVVWQALVERGWANITDERVLLTGDGVFYTPLIQSLLAKHGTGRLQPIGDESQ